MNVLAIDIGGTKLACGIVDIAANGRVSHARRMPTHAERGGAAVMADVLRLARVVHEDGRANGLALERVGVGAAGQIDPVRGVVSYAGPTMPGWQGVDIATPLRDAFALPVHVDNDVNALARGELRFGDARGVASALFVAVGTGIGGGLIVNGAVWSGHTHTAGEIGSLLIDWRDADAGSNRDSPLRGCVEDFASGPAITRRYNAASALTPAADLRAVHQRAQGGDPDALAAIKTGARALGYALRGLLNALDPALLILGGGVPSLGAIWLDPLTAVLRGNPQPGPANIRILSAARGDDAPLAGAAAVAARDAS